MNDEYSSQNTNNSEATESIKTYLKHLKNLKKRYKEIINELMVEENMNIHAVTLQVLQSEEFKRLSLNSGT